MGSLRYARRCRDRGETIVGMLSLETLGYYSDARGSQKFEACPQLRLLYPDTGNFVAFVANTKSADLTKRVVGSFRDSTRFPAHGCCLLRSGTAAALRATKPACAAAWANAAGASRRGWCCTARCRPPISERRKPVQRAREIKAGFRPFRRRSDQGPPLSPQTRERRTPATARQQGVSPGSGCKQTGRPRERPTG